MKTASILTESEKEELRQWCRSESALTTFARSLRMEDKAPSAEPKEGESSVTEDPDLLAGIDLDSLPTEAREALIARNEQFKSIKTKATEAESKIEKITEQARSHQARADRFHGKLKEHNLLDAPSQQSQTSAKEAALETAMLQKLVAGGMPLAQAQSMAKVFSTVAPDLIAAAKDETLQSVGGLAASVGNMQADHALEIVAARDETLSIPEVRAGVVEQIKFLTSQGNIVDTETIQTLTNMQYGIYCKTNPEGVVPTKPTATVNIHTRGSRGSLNQPTKRVSQDNSAPVAANPETAAAASAVVALMVKSLPKKK